MPNNNQNNPELFTLQKMQPEEITDTNSRIFCDGHFFPVAKHGVTVADYEADIYRLTPQTRERIAKGCAKFFGETA